MKKKQVPHKGEKIYHSESGSFVGYVYPEKSNEK